MSVGRYLPALLAGAAGFIGGTFYKGSQTSKNIEVSAATIVNSPVPMDVDEQTPKQLNIMRFGFPGIDPVRVRKSYILSYDRRNRVPHWVLEHLTPDLIRYNESVSRSKTEFFEDETMHHYFRSRLRDYRGSGYDRGHLAAAGNHRSSQELLDDTFVLSNIAPQVGEGFNRGAWNNLEKRVRYLAKRNKNVYVLSGPLYLPRNENDGKKYVKYEVIGDTNVAVPTHFFKIVLSESKHQELSLETYVMPNSKIDDKIPLEAFLVPKDTIERASGLLLFDKLPKSAFKFINGNPVQDLLE